MAYCVEKALPPQMLAPDLKCGPELRTLFYILGSKKVAFENKIGKSENK